MTIRTWVIPLVALLASFREARAQTCLITNPSQPFSASISRLTNSVTLTWGPTCTNYAFGVFSTDQPLSTNSQYQARAGMWGSLSGTSQWTDIGVTNLQRFYKILRIEPTPSSDWAGDGLSDEWDLQYGLNPFDPGLATNDVDGNGYTVLDDFLMGANPTDPSDPITVYVDSMNTNGVWDGSQAHPFRYIQDAIECSVPVTSNLAIRVRPGNYYETVSNQHYDTNGVVLTKRQFVYLYAANSDWSLSTDPESHIIDSSGAPNGDVLINPNFGSTSAIELYDVSQARINGFTIRHGQGLYGGILAYSSANGPIYISNCIIEMNGSAGGESGGIFIEAGTNSIIYNTVIAKNTGAFSGVADYNGSRIWNCTIVSNVNTTTDFPAVASLFGLSNVRNSVIWGNGYDVAFVDADYSTFGSNESVVAGAHNLSVDPILVNTANGNYRLQTNTAVLAAGTSLPIEQRDLYGNPRPLTGSFDIGANQYIDSDGDGMQDDWEIKHGLNPHDPTDVSGDPDGDCLTNLQEYNLNTDPNNPDTSGDGISDGPCAPPGSGLQPGPDPNPVTPGEVITAAFLDPKGQAVWQYYVNGASDPSWVNEPPTQPRWLKFNKYHIGDQFNIQMQYLSGPTNDTMYFLVALQSKGAYSVLPDSNATPVLQFVNAAPPGQLTPPGGWTTTVWQATLTNFAGPCAGFDDETLELVPGAGPALSVPQAGTTTFSAIITPTNIVPQVIFQIADTNLAMVTPSTASSAQQTVTVTGIATGNTITNTTLSISGVGAQNSWTSLTSQVAVDILPERTNVTVALYFVTAQGESNTVPTMVPTQAALKSYLDSVYGTQANVYMTVLPPTNIVVNYDFNGNGGLDYPPLGFNFLDPEEAAITGAVFRAGMINIYYVHVLYNPLVNAEGITYGKYPGSFTFIQDDHGDNTLTVTGHEIGHALGLQHPAESGSVVQDRIMISPDNGLNPCRLIRSEWTTANNTAKQ